jgi:hypothetical protein
VRDEPGKFRIEIKNDHGAEQYDGTLDAVTTMLFEVARKKVQAYLEKTQQKFDEYRVEIEDLRITFGWLDDGASPGDEEQENNDDRKSK